jgi:hypothetical protein
LLALVKSLVQLVRKNACAAAPFVAVRPLVNIASLAVIAE